MTLPTLTKLRQFTELCVLFAILNYILSVMCSAWDKPYALIIGGLGLFWSFVGFVTSWVAVIAANRMQKQRAEVGVYLDPI